MIDDRDGPPPSSAPPDGPPPGPPEPTPPPPNVTHRKRNRFSLVWIVPVVALIVGAGLVGRTLLLSGPNVTIEFRSADGIEAGRTEVRYKEVTVGRVTAVQLAKDRQHVRVSVSLQKSVEDIAVADTRFWVVRPRIGTGGVTGLGTLVSGAYIAVDAGVSEEQMRDFTGLEVAPYVLRGEPGRSFNLDAADLGSLDVGSPIYYRRARVGRVVGYSLDPVKDTLGIKVFIESPYESLVKRESKFWNASGVDLSLNARGLTLNTQSLASVFAGGVAFATPKSASTTSVAPEGQRFDLFASETVALTPPDGPPVHLRMLFEQSGRGLTVGAPIDLLGVEIGTVKSVALQYDSRTTHFPVQVEADIFPPRLGNVRDRVLRIRPVPDGASEDGTFMKRLVESGLRAQLRTANLLTGQQFVALDFVPNASKVDFLENAEVLDMPSVPGTFNEIQPQIASIINRIGKIHFDQIGDSLETTLKNAGTASLSLNDTLKSATAAIAQLSPEAQQALVDVRKTLTSVQETLNNLDRNVTQSDSPLQRNANDALVELQRTAQALRVLSDYIQQHPESLIRGKAPDRDVTRTPEDKK